MLVAQDAIIAAVVAALKQAPAIAGGNVFEDDELDGLPENIDLAVSVGLGVSEVQRKYMGVAAPLWWVSLVRVTTLSRRDGRNSQGERPSRALQHDVLTRLAQDPFLGGLVSDFRIQSIRPSDPERWATNLGAVDAVYVAEHRSAFNGLAAA
jgi:hypothetical protein